MKLFFLCLRLWCLIPLLILLASHSAAQCVAPYQDFNNFVYVFDGGETHYIENLPVRSYKVSRSGIFAYIVQNNRLRVYYKGKVYPVSDVTPNYYMTDNWFLYQNLNLIRVLDDNEFKSIETFFRPDIDSLFYSDSLIVWTNAYGELNVYYDGKTQTIERTEIRRAKIGPNIFAYMDRNNNFKVFYHGEIHTIETYEPANFIVHQDMVMYIDQYGNFKFFHDGELSETSTPNITQEYTVGRDFAVYISALRQLVVYYKGEETILMEDRPLKYSVVENLLVYTDKGKNFWCWYKGKKYWLERYLPLSWKMDNDIVVYQDLDGKLKGFYYGEQVQVSDQIVPDYKLFNEAVTYSLQPFETKIWCDKKTYTYR